MSRAPYWHDDQFNNWVIIDIRRPCVECSLTKQTLKKVPITVGPRNSLATVAITLRGTSSGEDIVEMRS